MLTMAVTFIVFVVDDGSSCELLEFLRGSVARTRTVHFHILCEHCLHVWENRRWQLRSEKHGEPKWRQ